ncbi:FHA domain-containing protein [Deinococcus sp. QL22]|uniref:FHA domain-containing protein n=1 Tax=Deinococcus sp. QL22 TaxID=2939437 RepID=UPI0020177563|nr:FHA domain-containing protein [Deinococcus sp. QL22]UQN08355.1 FHA domain-containing protein [Deinococcus sp. QL22]
MTILCTVCGTANPEGTTYCEGCGVELSATAAPTPTTTPQTPQEVLPEVVSTEAAPAPVDATPPAAVFNEPPVFSEAPVSSAELTAAAPTEPVAEEAAPVGGEFTEESASATPVSPELGSELSTAEGAAPAPAAETPSATPVLTGEAKLGIKKFGAPTGEFIPLQGERLVVGRFDASSGPVDIDLSGLGGQEHISRRHAELYRELGVWAVRDLGSTNGVYIKRKGEPSFSPRLQEPATLTDGDELAFGNLMLIFHQS